MRGALIIFIVMVVVGVVLYIGELWHLRKTRLKEKDLNGESLVGSGSVSSRQGVVIDETGNDSLPETGEPDSEVEGECCGLHLVCEKDSLSPMSAEVLYYDDEELDRFIGRSEDSYTPEEVEEFRDVLMTLRPEDIFGWARSVTQRRLPLPPEVRDELLILVNEQRERL